jgi:adenosine deaminase
MSIEQFIAAMPKVELHVHLEGAIQPETVLALARRHDVTLPANTVEGLREWYHFTDFTHFVEIYLKISECLRTPDDIELVAREFLAGQARQNIQYSEVTYTAYTHYATKGMAFEDQLAAINRARAWADDEFGARMGLIVDIPRMVAPDAGLLTADWAIAGHGRGVVALGLGGIEVGNPPEKFAAAFDRAYAAGLPIIPHAGETVGPESIWNALRFAHPARIGHGVRAIEDAALLAELRERQIPLEVSPTSNICLGVAPSMEQHPLPRLLDAGLYVTINSDDPPMFNTTLTDEYQTVARTFGLGEAEIERLVMNAVEATLLPADEKTALAARFRAEFADLARQGS